MSRDVPARVDADTPRWTQGHARPAGAPIEAGNGRERRRAVHLAAAELLVVLVAFLVAVVEAADGRVAPVDDADAGLGVEVGRAPDQDLALAVVLFEEHPAEVGRARIDGALGHLRAARGDLLQALHLLDERRDVLEPRLVDLIAQVDELGVVVDARGLAPALRARGQVLQDARQDLLFLGRDSLEVLVRLVGLSG
ncbi:MAG: hypothetical protein K8H88_27805 [Sandaracinaceae bacterium]|nr:hypothetical protein [Sandaracinaceae bacterium]